MPTFVTVRAAVLTKINTLVGGGQKLVVAYDRHEPNISGFPAATFDVSDNQSDFLSNRDNLRTIAFQVIIYQTLRDKGLDAATSILDAAVDDVISAFENDPTLSGAIDWSIPIPGRRIRFTAPQGDTMAQVLTLQCNFTTALTF